VAAIAQVRAGGGVVVRSPESGAVEVLAVHRPRYDDWSLPKGKLKAGEAWEAGALREVEEETGLRCTIERELESIEYLDRKGRRKRVRYWLMRPVNGGDVDRFEPNDEVDRVRWLPAADAAKALDYRHDRDLVRELI
jgi:8-oxo-dGTP diphosphatase